MVKNPSERIALKLRLPKAVRRQLERIAEINGKSLNAEIVRRLETSLREDAPERAGAEAGWRDAKLLLKSGREGGERYEKRLQALIEFLEQHFPEVREELARKTGEGK